jgi:hypothetical protein
VAAKREYAGLPEERELLEAVFADWVLHEISNLKTKTGPSVYLVS